MVNEKNSYVYFHRRLDTNEIFYVGISRDKKFKRPFDKSSRSLHWNNIVKKFGYTIEIPFIELTWEQACSLERHYIVQFGRRDLNSGTLVNLTSGGEGVRGWQISDEFRKMKSLQNRGCNNPFYRKKHSDKTKQLISDFRKGKLLTKEIKDKISQKIRRGNHYSAKLVFDLETGIFYDCIKDASEAKGIKYRTLVSYFRKDRKNHTNLILV